jgi:L-ascorbate metabolism protein UlaG (beta-lactamase superfamily)
VLKEERRAMRLKWCGHACFRLTAQNRFTIVADPYEESVGYRLPPLTADLVTLSHSHYDHNYSAGVAGRPLVVSQPGPVPAKLLPPGLSVYFDPEYDIIIA